MSKIQDSENNSFPLVRGNGPLKLELSNQESELERTSKYIKAAFIGYSQELIFAAYIAVFLLLFFGIPQISTVTLVAYVGALLLDPIASILQKKGFSRAVATSLTLGTIAILILLLIGSVIPLLIKEYGDLLTETPKFVSSAYASIKQFINDSFGVTLGSDPAQIEELIAKGKSIISADNISTFLHKIMSGLFAGYSATLALLNIVILPLLLFYFLRDWDLINKNLQVGIPMRYRVHVSSLCSDVRGVLLHFAKGQALVSVALMVLYAVALLVVGVPYAIPIGFISGALAIIPYFGFACGIIISALVQGAHDPTTYGFLKILLAFGVVQFIEGNIITPKLVGEAMGLHPLVVIMALMIGGSAFGLIGLILAIPVSALIRTLYNHHGHLVKKF